MSFPRYPKYKDSGVEWLGNVPEHWEVGKCGFYLTVLSGFAFPSAGFSGDASNAKLLRGINVGVSKLKWDETVYWQRMEGDDLDIYELTAGDVVIGMDRPLIGDGMRVAKVTPSDLPCLLLQRVASLNTDDRLLGDYLLGFLSSEMFVAHFSPETTGVSVPHISPEQIGNFVIAVPPLHEQARIVAFLDCETAKIDELVAEQRRLIELLKEKRQAVISHAVTKGLNPNAPMKPSGIEWLGDVPEHWMVKPLGRLGQLQNGLNIGGEAFGAGDPFVSYGDVYKNANVPTIPSGLVLSTSSDQEKYDLDIGDVLFTRTSETVDDIGVASTCLCPIPRVTFAGFLIRFRPIKGLLEPRYSTFLFRNQGVQGHFSGTMNLVTRASLSQEVLKLLPICVPPIMEQQAIAQFIEQQVAAFCDLIAEATRAVELLQERRTALISAAVTGKIDVRSFAPQIPEVA